MSMGPTLAPLYLHHLKLHNHTWGWTKGNRKQLTEFQAQTQKVKNLQPKKSTQDSTNLAPYNNIAVQAGINYKTVCASHINLILMWQALSHMSKAKIHLQDSMHQAHAHHAWSMHVFLPKSRILRAAPGSGRFWRLKHTGIQFPM